MLLTDFLFLASSACFSLLYILWLLAQGWTVHSGLVLPTSLIKTVSIGFPIGQFDGGIFSIAVSFSQVTPAYVKLTKSDKQASKQMYKEPGMVVGLKVEGIIEQRQKEIREG